MRIACEPDSLLHEEAGPAATLFLTNTQAARNQQLTLANAGTVQTSHRLSSRRTRGNLRIAALRGHIDRDPLTDMMVVNGEFTTSIVLARCHEHDSGRRRWRVRFDTSLLPDITVAVRLDGGNAAALDYYLLPRIDYGLPRVNLFEQNAAQLESYRFDTLDYLYAMAEHTRLRWAA